MAAFGDVPQKDDEFHYAELIGAIAWRRTQGRREPR